MIRRHPHRAAGHRRGTADGGSFFHDQHLKARHRCGKGGAERRAAGDDHQDVAVLSVIRLRRGVINVLVHHPCALISSAGC